ncbi:unnamed protein product [Zymoseptoria tritici ST99CH_3D1]|nr:unnamed protein product [Zymoseptoria tritici ST99CH_3D1]
MKGLCYILSTAVALGIGVAARDDPHLYCLCQYGYHDYASAESGITQKVCGEYDPPGTVEYFKDSPDAGVPYCKAADGYFHTCDSFLKQCNAQGAGGGCNCWG